MGKKLWQKGIFLWKKVNSPIEITFFIILWEKNREVEEIQRFLRKISPIEIAILVFYGKEIWR